MALIQRATLTPSKIELLVPWLRSRAWAGEPVDVRAVGAYRFDDPDGRVGIETFFLESGDGTVLHVPVTYRDCPLPGAHEHLIGTTEHSVLGTRWVYDGCGDPVWAQVAAQVILGGGRQASEFVDDGAGGQRELPTTATAEGSGSAGTTPAPVIGAQPRDETGYTVVTTGGPVLVVARIVGSVLTGVGQTLTACWGSRHPVVVAGVRC